ncbi:hypothetical protein [Flagellimonas aequoris]|uniref:Uncharacterized protein n=1 Tax=Flagellimonas aequoris TaxID=2306997 RepID=A0A418N7U2_9FLAO|nr:hypothetical protein [Allomuricauda aequoris]RIV70764.1 hypothetical protein D2U88_10425 [Allomuricauda aequoris]TXK02203.1 hypothetical protein FQ019_10345 [Allomuricauda aequoris]
MGNSKKKKKSRQQSSIEKSRIRLFFEDSKVYFETFGAAFLSLMAIIVAYNSNKIADTQTKLLYQSLQPNFSANSYREKINDSVNEYWGTDVNKIIDIYNYGGGYYNLKISFLTQMFIIDMEKEFVKTNKYMAFDFLDSIPMQIYRQEIIGPEIKEGQIASFKCSNLRLLHKEANDLVDKYYVPKMNKDFNEKVHFLTYIKIECTDLNRNPIKNYYLIDINGIYLIDPTKIPLTEKEFSFSNTLKLPNWESKNLFLKELDSILKKRFTSQHF